MDWITPTLGAVAPAVLAVAAATIKLYGDVRVLQSKVDDRDKALEAACSVSSQLTTRVAVLEGVGTELRSLINAFKDIPNLLAKVEAMLSVDRERLNRIEDKMAAINR